MLKLLATLIAGWAWDGDTIHFYFESGDKGALRLQGVIAPERWEPGGAAATKALNDIVTQETMSCDLAYDGSYGRFVGRCTYGRNLDLGCELVRTGLVFPAITKDYPNEYELCLP